MGDEVGWIVLSIFQIFDFLMFLFLIIRIFNCVFIMWMPAPLAMSSKLTDF